MSRVERIELGLLISIVFLVGGAAGTVSFPHVHDWTIANSPERTPDRYGWVNSCLSELAPIACLLDIRRRRRAGRPITNPVTVLIAAVCLSLAAQLALAVPSPSGWLLSAVPALAFMTLSKLALSGLPMATPKPTPAPRPHRRRGTDKPATPASPRVPSVSPGLIPRPHHYRGRLTDAEVLEALRDPNRVPRGEDGTVSIRQAVKALGIGSDRARRLLDEVGLRRPVPAT